jgi:hypothetical protein
VGMVGDRMRLIAAVAGTGPRRRCRMTPAAAGRNAWIWIHFVLALVGIAAFVLNFAGLFMPLPLRIRREAGSQ